MKTETFLKINYELLDEGYTLSQAAILSYLKSFQEQNKYCYQFQKDIATKLRIPFGRLKIDIKILSDKKLIFTSQDKKYLNAAFNNRKAIILVDDKNPLPTIEEEITIPTAEAFTGQTQSTQVVSVVEKVEEDLPQAKEIVEEEIIPQLEPKFKLPSNLTSLYWQDEENIEWLQKYMLDGYKIEGVLEPNLKIRLENYKEKYLIEITNN